MQMVYQDCLIFNFVLQAQSKLIWEIRDKLNRDVSNNALKALLEYNGQDIPPGESRVSIFFYYYTIDYYSLYVLVLSHEIINCHHKTVI